MAIAQKPKVCCINLGYYQVKASNDVCFKSKAKITTDDKQLAMGDILELNGVKYLMEDGTPILEGNKTQDEKTKAFVLNALAKQLDNNEDSAIFNILLTSPPSYIRGQSKELPEFIEGEYNIVYNNKPLKITINNAIVYPETFIVYMVNNPSKLKGKKTLIIDIGGKTTNVCLLMDCKFNLEDYITLPQGMYHLDTNIYKMINSTEYTTYKQDDIDMFRNQNAKILDKYKKEIHEIYMEHVKEIVKEINIKSWEIDSYTNILICGGGGLVLEDAIQEVYPHARLSNEPVYDNLRALEVLAKGVFK